MTSLLTRTGRGPASEINAGLQPPTARHLGAETPRPERPFWQSNALEDPERGLTRTSRMEVESSAKGNRIARSGASPIGTNKLVFHRVYHRHLTTTVGRRCTRPCASLYRICELSNQIPLLCALTETRRARPPESSAPRAKRRPPIKPSIEDFARANDSGRVRV